MSVVTLSSKTYIPSRKIKSPNFRTKNNLSNDTNNKVTHSNVLDHSSFIIKPYISIGKVEKDLVNSYQDSEKSPIIESTINKVYNSNSKNMYSFSIFLNIKFNFRKLYTLSKGEKYKKILGYKSEKKTKELRIYFADASKGYITDYEKLMCIVMLENSGNIISVPCYILKDTYINQFYFVPITFKDVQYYSLDVKKMLKDINHYNDKNLTTLQCTFVFNVEKPSNKEFNRIILSDVNSNVMNGNKSSSYPDVSLANSFSGLSLNNSLNSSNSPLNGTTSSNNLSSPASTLSNSSANISSGALNSTSNSSAPSNPSNLQQNSNNSSNNIINNLLNSSSNDANVSATSLKSKKKIILSENPEKVIL